LAGPLIWGTFHLTSSGNTTWYSFAREILREAERYGHPGAVIRPVSSAEYPVKAPRPPYSVLDTSVTEQRFGIIMPTWRDALARCIQSKFASASMSKVVVP
jgi:dTDP-4-dehydrorhamnose reductase